MNIRKIPYPGNVLVTVSGIDDDEDLQRRVLRYSNKKAVAVPSMDEDGGLTVLVSGWKTYGQYMRWAKKVHSAYGWGLPIDLSVMDEEDE